MANGSDGYVATDAERRRRRPTSPTPTAEPTGWLPDSGRCPMRSRGRRLIDAALHGIHSVIDADLRATVDEMESAILRNRTSRGPVSL